MEPIGAGSEESGWLQAMVDSHHGGTGDFEAQRYISLHFYFICVFCMCVYMCVSASESQLFSPTAKALGMECGSSGLAAALPTEPCHHPQRGLSYSPVLLGLKQCSDGDFCTFSLGEIGTKTQLREAESQGHPISLPRSTASLRTPTHRISFIPFASLVTRHPYFPLQDKHIGKCPAPIRSTSLCTVPLPGPLTLSPSSPEGPAAPGGP